MTTIRTSAADINRLSCSANVWGWDEGSDHAAPAESPPSVGLNLRATGPTHYSSYLKLCDGTIGVALTSAVIEQGLENAVDFNARASDCFVMAEFGSTGMTGDQVVTIKGGCSNIAVAGTIYSHGREADVTLDAWSDQSSVLVSGIDLSGLTRADGQPVTIILGRFGSKVDAYPASYRVLRWKSWGYAAYHVVKTAYVAILKAIGRA